MDRGKWVGIARKPGHEVPHVRWARYFMAVSLALAVPSAPIDASNSTLYVSLLGAHVPPFASWADASTTIQAAIDNAAAGDTVLVDSGRYTGNGNRDISFGGRAMCLLSVYGPDATILDCGGDYLNRHRGFRFTQGEDSSTIVSGFSVRLGYAPTDGPGGMSYGGGFLFDSSSSPTIRDCAIDSCVAEYAGGGAACLNSSQPSIARVRFYRNRVYQAQILSHAGFGGGIRCENSNPLIIGCVFDSNIAHAGGALSCNNSSPMVAASLMVRNLAALFGFIDYFEEGVGGACHLYQSSPTFKQTSMAFNRAVVASVEGRGGRGGAVAMFASSPSFESCTFHHNAAMSYSGLAVGLGGGFYVSRSTMVVNRSIISFSGDGSAVHCTDTLASPMFLCCDIFGNSAGDWTGCIEGQLGAGGNFSLDPLYCDLMADSLTLKSASPCATDQNLCGQQIGAMPVACNATAVEGEIEDRSSDLFADGLTLSPNPFNSALSIRFSVATEGPVAIRFYNSLGRLVDAIPDIVKSQGEHEVLWAPSTGSGVPLPSGVYFINVVSGEQSVSRAVTLLK